MVEIWRVKSVFWVRNRAEVFMFIFAQIALVTVWIHHFPCSSGLNNKVEVQTRKENNKALFLVEQKINYWGMDKCLFIYDKYTVWVNCRHWKYGKPCSNHPNSECIEFSSHWLQCGINQNKLISWVIIQQKKLWIT